MGSDDCYKNNIQEDNEWLRFIWAGIFMVINIIIFIVTLIQLYRTRGLLGAYSTNKVKITTRVANCLIALLCITLAVIDLDTWIFDDCPPNGDAIYIVYNLIKVITEIALCMSAVTLGKNLFRGYYRSNNKQDSNDDPGLNDIPSSMTIGWRIIGIIYVICSIAALVVAYVFDIIEAISIYNIVKTILGAIIMFYFSFCIFMLKKDEKISFSTNTILRRLYYGLIILGILCIFASTTLTLSLARDWGDEDTKSVTYYGLQGYKSYEYFVILVFLTVSWITYWLLLSAIIKQVYTKINQHALNISSRAINASGTQSIDMYNIGT